MAGTKDFTRSALEIGLQDCQKWGGCKGMTVEEYAKSINATWPPKDETGGKINQEVVDYEAYLDFLKTSAGKGWPTPKSIQDYLNNIDQWAEAIARGETIEISEPGERPTGKFSQLQINEWNDFKRLQKEYGQPGDWAPRSIDDFYDNYSNASYLLTHYRHQATQDYYETYGETPTGTWPETPIPSEIEEEREQALIDEYALSPEEAARRREEAYAESRYAAQERYAETPEYQPEFAQYLEQQGRLSGALEAWTEDRYPSLVSQFRATQPELTGYPTREEARAEAARRESLFQAWLPEQEPSLYQKYMSQRPAERGERLYMQQPTMTTVNW